MCLAVPLEIIEIDGEWAKAKLGQGSIQVNVSLVPGIKNGDYAVVHAGYAIERLDLERAKETLALIDELRSASEAERQ